MLSQIKSRRPIENWPWSITQTRVETRLRYRTAPSSTAHVNGSLTSLPQFKEITRAYEVLADPQKRELYDQYGEEGLESGGGGAAASDLFSELFGGGGRRRGGPRQKRKGEDVVFPLKVGLEDLYMGCTKKLRLTKNVLCKTCAGKGGVADAVQKCKSCKGHGVKIVIRQLGPGMIQQMQTHCNECNGDGTVIADKDRCKTCRGAKTVKEKKTLSVYVNKGMKHGQRVVFHGEADESVCMSHVNVT